MGKRVNSEYVLPWESARPLLPARRVILWTFVVAFILSWMVLFVRIDVPEANAQSVSGAVQAEDRALRRREVKALEEMSSTLKKIESKLRRR